MICLSPPTWLALPNGNYERLRDLDALYCGETEPLGGQELMALCDHHQRIHWFGIYGDDKLTKLFEPATAGS